MDDKDDHLVAERVLRTPHAPPRTEYPVACPHARDAVALLGSMSRMGQRRDPGRDLNNK